MNIQSKTDLNPENDPDFNPDFNPKLISTNIVGYITWINPQKFSASPIKYGDLRSIVSAMMAFGSCEPCIWVNGTKHMMEIDTVNHWHLWRFSSNGTNHAGDFTAQKGGV